MNNLSSKKKLIILTLILIALIIGVNILKALNNKEDIWNYKEITSATDVISRGSVITDRKTYYELEDIIMRFLLANDDMATNTLQTENIGYEASYKDYYHILTADYKKFLSKKEFEQKAVNFIEKFIELVDIEQHKVVKVRNIINKIYTYGEDKYLCELKCGNNVAYIGIILYEYNDSYNIFYIE